jgi:predicted nucleotide-binding protein
MDELDRLKAAFESLPIGSEAQLKQLRHELDNIIVFAVPDTQQRQRFLKAAEDVWFHPMAFVAGDSDPGPDREVWVRGRDGIAALISGIQHYLRFAKDFNTAAGQPKATMDKLFIVHGHNHLMLRDIEVFVRRIGLYPVILMEEASRGQTVIEKVENFADVPYAIVILSPDDVGRAAASPPADEKLRPRQNAVLEAGFFIGKLGRKNVAVVVDGQPKREAEYPSDLAGIVTIYYRPVGDWKTLLIREFTAARLIFDPSKA